MRFWQIQNWRNNAIKNASSVRPSLNNEIAYIESGQFPLVCDVKSRQLKFWMKMQEDAINEPNNYMSRLINLATEKNIPYIRYYKSLVNTHGNHKACKAQLRQQFREKWTSRIEHCSSVDQDSKLGVYKQINPDLQQNTYVQAIPEFERIQITRFRTGSHKVNIEKGRHRGKQRENRPAHAKVVYKLFIMSYSTVLSPKDYRTSAA